jgi:hypothetical protein
MDVARVAPGAGDDRDARAGPVLGKEIAVVPEIDEHRGRGQEVEREAEVVAAAVAVGAGVEEAVAVRRERLADRDEKRVRVAVAGNAPGPPCDRALGRDHGRRPARPGSLGQFDHGEGHGVLRREHRAFGQRDLRRPGRARGDQRCEKRGPPHRARA